MNRLLSVVTASLLCAGCATNTIRGPSATISQSVAELQGSLTAFQADWRGYQDEEQDRTFGYTVRGQSAGAANRQMAAQWALAAAQSDAEAFAALKMHADEEARIVGTPPPTRDKLEEIKFPTGKLAEVVAGTARLAKPADRRAQVEALVSFGKDVNTELAALEAAAAKQAKADRGQEGN